MGLTAEQLLFRRTAIGASEIAALVGLSRWKTPMQVFASKRGEPDDSDSLPAELGTLLEDPISAVIQARTGTVLFPVDSIRHPEFKFAVATPDRAVFAPGWVAPAGVKLLQREHLGPCLKLCQIKSTTWRQKEFWGVPGSDAVPEDYLCQEQWEMGVSGVKSADIAVLFDKDRLETYCLQFDATIFDGLYAIAERFMHDHVLTGIPPPPDASAGYGEALERVYPRQQSERLVDAPDAIGDTIVRFAVLRQAKKLVEQGMEFYRSRITYLINKDTGIQGKFGKITWKRSKDSVAIDHEKAFEAARMLAGLLLNRFGPSLTAVEREQLEAQLRGLSAIQKVKQGSRRLHVKWSPAFEADLAGMMQLDLSAISQELQAVPGSAPELGAGEEMPEEST